MFSELSRAELTTALVESPQGMRKIAETIVSTQRDVPDHQPTNPVAIVFAEDGQVVGVPRVTQQPMTDGQRSAYLEAIRCACVQFSAIAVCVMFYARFHWSTGGPSHDVCVVLFDHAVSGYTQFLAEVVDQKIGPVMTLEEMAKQHNPGKRFGKAKNLTGRYGRLLPRHWMN